MKIFTVDLEDWFHLLDHPDTRAINSWAGYPPRIYQNTIWLLDELDVSATKATFFVLGWVAEQYPDLILEISNRGHEIGTHSYAHQLVYSQSKQEFEEDLKKSISIIENLINCPVKLYRAPGFSITSDVNWAFDVLVENGIEVDCSIFGMRRAHGGHDYFKSVSTPFSLKTENGKILKCLPMSFKYIFSLPVCYSGGGYFRLTPKIILKQLFKGPDYTMLYIHPRDLDPDQPQLPGLTLGRRFKSYVGLRYTKEKMISLLARENFVTVSSAIEEIEWESKKCIELKKCISK